MILPLSVDVDLPRRPFANWLLIAVTVVAFFLTTEHAFLAPRQVPALALDGFGIGIITHVLLHANVLHLLGNMLFLWVFGNAICARLGGAIYLACYLLFAIAAALAHLLLANGPAVGASGAVNGMVGMFLVFFPKDYVNVSIVMLNRTLAVPAWVLVGFWLLLDVFGLLSGEAGVAYGAHLGGFFAGALTAIALLKLDWAGDSPSPSLLDLQ
jgi:membrane associated rhomboid family serine protease